MENRLLEGDPALAGVPDRELSRVRAIIDAGKSLGKAVSDGDIDLATAKRLLLSGGSTMWDVRLLKEIFAGQKVAADLAYVLALPVAASDRAIRIVQEIKLSATDATVRAACDSLLDELENGRRDYLQRMATVLGDGKTSLWLQKQLARGATAAFIVKPLLAKLGFVGVAGQATNIVGLLFAGTEVGMSLSGEKQAYPHARLAHFADQLKPDLSKRWHELGERLDPADGEACQHFDAASEAAILIDAFVNQEGRLVKQAYETAAIPRACKEDVFASQRVFADAYGDWVSGATFKDHAPKLTPPAAEPTPVAEPEPEPTAQPQPEAEAPAEPEPATAVPEEEE
jgi:hypothetical protein